jgi:predicted Zn-dependent protease with MMP-like domain
MYLSSKYMQSAGKLPRKLPAEAMDPWKRLQQQAQSVLETTLAELPNEIRAEAEKIPCLLEKECADDPEILGTYGHFVAGEMSETNGPIVLYLETIERYCWEEGEDFAAEVRLTYLHELGHHFGWDEDDLEQRGLA